MRGKNLLDFSLCQQVWESSGISWGDMNMFLILFCWVTDPHMSLTTSGQSFFQQPFRVTAFSWTMQLVVYILNILNTPELSHDTRIFHMLNQL
jgi:hypothetical protein